MGKIKFLPPEVVSQIAAGEVIERPAYAVKELIENAIDANATQIKIYIKDSGLTKIIVTDNGEGMDEEDLKRCCHPHTTSKLSDNNLYGIQTFGFRGEALASIAAICQITIISRRPEQALGYQITYSAGKCIDSCTAGAPIGTAVVISNLFSHVPARKKFLKSQRTEFRHILEIVSAFALAYPKIHFELSHNQKTIFELNEHQTLPERIKIILGPSIYENLIPLEFEDSYLSLSGFICKPQITTSTTKRHHLFVNNRRVSDLQISQATKDSYGSMLEPQSYPVFILFIDLPSELVDINVHPRKEQIAFIDQSFIVSAINQAVSRTLSEHNLTFYNLAWKNADLKLTSSYAGKLLKKEVLPWKEEIGEINTGSIIQIHNLYLLCPSKQGVMIVDQHAASERILFERFKEAFTKHKGQDDRYYLPKPQLLNLSLHESQILQENLTLFENLGFCIEPFGDTAFKIEAVPMLFQDRAVDKVILETLDDIANNGKPKDIDTQSQKMLEYLACRSAIKAGDKLTGSEAKELIEEFNQLKGAYTCPHGRPVTVEVSLSHLDKLFKRR